VNFNVAIDANSEITLLSTPLPNVTNVIVAQADLDVKSLYDADGEKGLIEIWEPSDAQGDIKCQLASTDTSPNGGPDLSGAYQVACKTFAQGLQAVLCDKFDCSGVAPFNNAKYNAQEAYTMQRDFGRVALATFAHYLFGHVDATAAITNDISFVQNMLSITDGGADETQTGADTRAAAWRKNTNGNVETWDSLATQEDANLALRLVEAVIANGKDANGEIAESSVQNATSKTLSNIVKQVIGQDSSRANNVDGSQRTRNQHQLLRFYPDDIIYMNIVVKTPTVEVTNESTAANPPQGSLSSDRSFTLKIKLKNGDSFLYTDGTKTVISGYKGTVPATVVLPNGVTGIADEAFLNATGLQSITFPAGLLTIGARAFKGCTSLASIDVPSSVTSIGEAAFEGCTSLTSANLPGQGTRALPRAQVNIFGTKATPARFMKKRTLAPSGPSATEPVPAPPKLALAKRSLARTRLLSTTYSAIAPSLFKDCTSLASVLLPPGIVMIGVSAFQGCSALTAISIPNITSIGISAFEGAGLTSITIPSGIGALVANVFKDCSGLTTVTIPSNVGTIGALAFYGCTGLTSVSIAEGVASINTQAFQGCTALTTVDFPSTLVTIATRAFLGCGLLAIALVPTTVTIVNTPLGAFPNATVITYYNPSTNFTFSDTAETTLIGYKGTVPSSLRIPSSVTTIKASAFAGMGVTYAKVSPTLTIESGAFDVTAVIDDAPTGLGTVPKDASGNMIAYGVPLQPISATNMGRQIPVEDLSGFVFNINGTNYGNSIYVTTNCMIVFTTAAISATTLTSSHIGIACNGRSTAVNYITYFRTTTADYDIVTIQFWFENAVGSLTGPTLTVGSTEYLTSSGQMQVRLIKRLTDLRQFVELRTNKGSSAAITNIGQYAIANGVTLTSIASPDMFSSSKSAVWAMNTTGTNVNSTDFGVTNYSIDTNNTNSARNLTNMYLDPKWALNPIPNNATMKTSQSRGIKTDSAGNIYVCGYISLTGKVYVQNILGNANTQSTVTLESSSLLSMAYLIKYDSSGIAQWATYFDGTGADQTLGIAFDSTNNIYITGQYTHTSVLRLQDVSGTTQKASTILLPTAPSASAFLVKYNTSGVAQWATCIDGTGSDIGYGIAIDSTNNIYITGQYISTTLVTLKNVNGTGQVNSSITLPISSSSACFLVKYSSSGIAQWATNIRGSSTIVGYAIGIDSTNSIYITGSYYTSSAVTLQNASGSTQTASSITLPATSSSSGVFLVKYNTSGITQWATYFNSPSTDYAYGIAFDSINSIYITGSYYSSSAVILQDVSGTTQKASSINLPITNSSGAVFLVKYNAGGVAQWATFLNGTHSDNGRGIAIDSTNNIYMTGIYTSTSAVILQDANGTTQINSAITLPNINNSTLGAVFLVKYNASGITQWATYLDGNAVNDVGYAIAVRGDAVYISGVCANNTTISIPLQDASGTTQRVSALALQASASDASFVVQYTTDGIVQAASTCLSTGTSAGSITFPSRMAKDASGNIYWLYNYSSMTALPVKNISGASQVDSDITLPSTYINGSVRVRTAIIKYNPSSIAQWATVVSNSVSLGANNMSGISITVDASNNVYVGGQYYSTVAFELSNANGTGQAVSIITLPIALTTPTGFVVQYNTDGVAQWAIPFTSSVYGVAVDTTGSVYVTGGQTIPNSTLWDASGDGQAPSDVTNTVSGGLTAGIYLCKYDADGIALWATNIDTISGYAGSFYNTLVVDSTNSIYLATPVFDGINQIILNNANGTGQAPSTVTIPPLSSTTSSMLLVKYNQDGIVQWATYTNPGTSMIPYKIAVDSSNDIYITGAYRSAAAVVLQDANGGTQQPSAISLPLNSTDAAFLIKYNANGVVQWGVHLDGNNPDAALGLVIDGMNNVYITGFYTSSGFVFVYDASGNTQVISTKSFLSNTISGLFMIKYSPNGKSIQTSSIGFGGLGYARRGQDLLLDSNTLYMTGNVSGIGGAIYPQYAYGYTTGTSLISTPVGYISPILIQYSIQP
jgi:hypothetical protein